MPWNHFNYFAIYVSPPIITFRGLEDSKIISKGHFLFGQIWSVSIYNNNKNNNNNSFVNKDAL
jgi:hypothetical protein